MRAESEPPTRGCRVDTTDFHETDSEMEEIELYDHERKAISDVYARLSENIGANRTLTSFEDEIVTRMGEIGFRVKVLFFEAQRESGERFIMPQVSVIGRIEKEDEDGFDHARQAHEVQTDLLGLRKGEDVRVSKPLTGYSRSSSGLYVPGG